MNKLTLILCCFLLTSSFAQEIVWSASSFERNKLKGFSDAYFHIAKEALAVNPVQFPNGEGAVEKVFGNESGVYNLRLTSLLETDGESFYSLFVNGVKINEFQNPETRIDYLPHYFHFSNVSLKKGDTLKITFRNHSNGKIPEGDGFAFARARWTEIAFFQNNLLVVKNGQNASYEFSKTGIAVKVDGKEQLRSMDAAHWAVATSWKDQWATDWQFAEIDSVTASGDWVLLHGHLKIKNGIMKLRDAYRIEKGILKGTRRWEWQGSDTLEQVTLSIQFRNLDTSKRLFMPSLIYYGNPSGANSGTTPVYNGDFGERAYFEEHRFPMPFVSQETNESTLSLHSLPSKVQNGNYQDQWWSLGAERLGDGTMIGLLSGPTASNKLNSVIKAEQQGDKMWTPYDHTWMQFKPGDVVEKTFYLDAQTKLNEGSGFQASVHKSIELFDPFYMAPFPSSEEIIAGKYKYAQTRWITEVGFNQFEKGFPNGEFVVFGWVGQAAALGYALQKLEVDDSTKYNKIQTSLDLLSTAEFYEDGFYTWYNVAEKKWGQRIWKKMPETLSQGQGMFNMANAILAAEGNSSLNSTKWKQFLKKASDFHANRILEENWLPKSTNEAFLIAPLVIAYDIFQDESYLKAAQKGGKHYIERHLNMKEPYWGGTLDAKCEDKEGAFGAFQAFLYLYESTQNVAFLDAAKHACDVALSYTFVWDVDFDAGRLHDHAFKTRGWTSVSVQNMHIDVYGVLVAPFVYKLSKITNDENLKSMSELMFRSCGQLIDPYGSQGEQVQQTQYTQDPNTDHNFKNFRGGYVEKWTVFWITAHFLNAAALFEDFE